MQSRNTPDYAVSQPSITSMAPISSNSSCNKISFLFRKIFRRHIHNLPNNIPILLNINKKSRKSKKPTNLISQKEEASQNRTLKCSIPTMH